MSEKKKVILWLAVLIAVATPLAVSTQEAPAGAERSYLNEEVVISEETEADIQLLGGSLTIEEDVKGDVIALAADVTVAEGVTVEGNLYVLGGLLVVAGNVTGEVFAPRSIAAALAQGQRSIGEATSNPWSLVTISLKLGTGLAWLLLTLILVLALPVNTRAAAVEVGASPFYSFFLGLVALSSFAVTALAASYLTGTGVGEILLVALGLFAIATKIFGMVAVFQSIGRTLFGPRDHASASSGLIRGDLALAVMGLLVLVLLRLVPIVGNVVWAAVSLVGVGATLSTFFGRRDPAFIGYQAVGSS